MIKEFASTLPTKGPNALASALELRYQVYCLECNFLCPDDYPDGIERDEYDDTAAHFYAFDHDQQLAGYVRLVRPAGDAKFPFEQHCSVSADIRLPRPHEAMEISRLMVRKDYRRRPGDCLSGVNSRQNATPLSGDRRHQAPAVLLNLYRQMYQHCRRQGVRYLYAAMERTLARLLSQLSFGFQAIGPATDYYGPVAPYLADLRALEAQVQKRDCGLTAWLEQDHRHWLGGAEEAQAEIRSWANA